MAPVHWLMRRRATAREYQAEAYPGSAATAASNLSAASASFFALSNVCPSAYAASEAGDAAAAAGATSVSPAGMTARRIARTVGETVATRKAATVATTVE